MVAGIDHVTINTARLDTTQRFYVDVVGLELAPRPNLPIPGIWLKAKGGEGPAIVHVILDENHIPGTSQTRATVDHIAFHATDFETARSQIEGLKVSWCGNVIPDFGLWQLMFYDPNGVLIELNFKADAETCETPVIPDENRFSLDNFFEPEAYAAL